MNRSTNRAGLLLLAALPFVLFSASCKDSATEPSDDMSSDEAEWLFVSISHLLIDVTTDVGGAATGGASAQAIEVQIACPAGGSAEAVITGGDLTAGDTARLAIQVVLTPTDCSFIGEGYTLTMNGAPNVTIESVTSIAGALDDITINSTVQGTVAWEIADRSGNCEIDMELSATLDPSDPDFAANYVGTVCGFQLEIVGVRLVPPTGGMPEGLVGRLRGA